MSHDKELEIRRQFLDEAQEYLEPLEDAVLGLASSRIDAQKINAALRAAHSIKGGAGMMGFQTLNDLAHRLEDSFKVLKVQKQEIGVDAELEHLLLAGIDCLRHVIDRDRQNQPLSQEWLNTHAYSIYQQLHDRLGDPQAEDATSVLSPEDGQDILPILFETEIEGCLQRLETVLESPEQPCLREELLLLAQELGGLGEMLQLEAFSSLCASIAGYVETAAEVEPVARVALQALRQSQALVLTQQLDLLPTAIEVAGMAPPPSIPEAPVIVAPAATIAGDVSGFFDDIESLHHPTLETTHSDQTPVEVTLEPFSRPETAATAPDFASLVPPTTARSSRSSQQARSKPPMTGFRDMDSAQEEDSDATVRVSVKQLNALNDLFGELTIDRNALDLYLKRLRNLTQTLTRRVQILERSNAQMRTAYDRVTTRGLQNSRTASSLKLLPPAGGVPALGSVPVVSETVPYSAWKLLQTGQAEFDELEMDRYDDWHLLSQKVMETIVQIQEVTSDIELSLDDTEQTTRSLNKMAKQLQNQLTQVRMRPLADVVDRFPRALRELCLQYGKQARLEVVGASTLIDRTILETLNDPLMHLFRNAFDHGIEEPEVRLAQGKPEEGVIRIQAFHRGNRTIITVQDDGGGIPIAKIRAKAEKMGLDPTLLAAASDDDLLSLIFEPGFSTTDQVTALSGRGVGMDVVRDSLKQVRGDIRVSTEPGAGTTFTLTLPFTLSVARVLIAESNGMLLAIPSDTIDEITAFQPEAVLETVGGDMLELQGNLIPLVVLTRWLRFYCPRYPYSLETPPTISTPTVLVVNNGEQTVGIKVDACWGEQEVAVRRVDGTIPLPAGFANCTILGDGRVLPLVNVPELLHWITSLERSSPSEEPQTTDLPRLGAADPDTSLSNPQARVLVVDDSINVRRFLAMTLEKAGYLVEQATDGQDALERLQAGLKVNAVVCDIEMPRLDGYGFLAKLKANRALEHLPVTMLTSRTSEKHKQLAFSLGAAAYFSKPYNEQALLANLTQHIYGDSPFPATASA